MDDMVQIGLIKQSYDRIVNKYSEWRYIELEYLGRGLSFDSYQHKYQNQIQNGQNQLDNDFSALSNKKITKHYNEQLIKTEPNNPSGSIGYKDTSITKNGSSGTKRAYSRHDLTVRPKHKQSVMLQMKDFKNSVGGNYD